MLTVVPSLFKGGSVAPAGADETPEFFVVYEHDQGDLHLKNLPPWKARFADGADAQHYADLMNGVEPSVAATPEPSAAQSLDDTDQLKAAINSFGREVLQPFILEVAERFGFVVHRTTPPSSFEEPVSTDPETILRHLGFGEKVRQQIMLVFPKGWNRPHFYSGRTDSLEFLHGLRALDIDQRHCESIMRLFNGGQMQNARREAARHASRQFACFVRATSA